MTSDKFKIGDTVLVKAFSAVGQILDLEGKFARVQLRGSVVKVALDDLERTKESFVPTVAGRAGVTLTSQAVDAGASALFTLDLHGQTTADAIELLEQRISGAVMAGMHEIEIVHGVGTGAVRDAVHARLGKLTAVAKFEVKYSNHGVTRVFLRG